MRKQILKLVLSFMLIPGAMLAQQSGKLSGQILDEYNEPVIGATVRVVGTNIATATDIDGNYSLSGVPAGAKLSFSCVGMKTSEVKATDGQGTLNAVLELDALALEETVVIGYGAAKAKDLTAPIETVKAADIQSTPSTSPMAALQGKVAGVNIVNSGTPGAGPSVTIRGMGSFGNTQPLFVVDGMFYDNINFLNNADIEELSILKDASAAAIYGVRAANGVVIITTKKGKKGDRAKVTYEGYVGIQKATNVLKMTNSSQYAQMLRETGIAEYETMLKASIAQYGGNFENNQYNADTNWYNELLRTAMITNHSLNIGGGTDKATYGVGISYLSQDGVMNTSNYYRRLNFRGNLEYKPFNWLTVGMNGVFSNGTQKLPNNAAWQQAFNMPGIFPVYDKKTDFTDGYASPITIGVTNNFYNPVATAKLYDNKNSNYQVLSNFYAQFNILPDNRLTLRTSYSYDYSTIDGVNFAPTYDLGPNLRRDVNNLTKSKTNYRNYVWDNVLTFRDKWGAHGLTAMVGTSLRQDAYNFLSVTAQNVPEGEDTYKYISLGNKEGMTASDGGYRYRALSFFGRFNYNYDDRYMAMVTLRRDGSSKYNDKWGFFPSFGAAWVISNEAFMADQKAFDYLKLRASWGKLGNDKVAASAGANTSAFTRAVYGTNSALDGYINTSNFSWLGWEVVKETNVGLNLSTLGNRLTADIDWYHRLTDNAVMSAPIPMTQESLAGNWAQILNTGVDLTLNWNHKLNKDWSYNVGLNLTYLHNEVKSLRDGLTMIGGGTTRQIVGEKMNSFYGYKVIGVYQTEAEVAADPIGVANNCVPGDFKYQDTNGNGELDNGDKQALGSYVPDVTYGFNLGFAWRNLDFNVSCYGQAGGEMWNRKRALRYAAQNYNFDLAQYENRWTGPGTSNTDPSAAGLMKSYNIGDSNNASYFVEKADYFRIQNITLGYSFKNIKIGTYTMPGIRLSLTADRPFTTFKAHSMTPEVSADGIDTEVYPLTSTYTFGVQIDF